MKGLKKMGLIEEIEQEEREGRPSVKTYAPTDFEIVLSSKMIHDTVLKEEEE